MKLPRPALPLWFLGLILGVLASAQDALARGQGTCEPSKVIRSVLEREEKLAASCGRSKECFEKRRALLAGELEKRPLDLFLHRAYQDAFQRSAPGAAEGEKVALAERYHQLALAHPRDARFAYLEGRMASEEPQAARRHFSRALELDPELPWAHLALATTPPPDGVAVPAGQAAGHLATFQRLCPSRTSEVLSAVPALAGEAGLEKIVAAARAALLGRPAAETVRLVSQLWQAEFRLLADGDFEPARRQVAADLARLEARPMNERPEYWHLLIEGRDLVRDFAGAGAARRELVRRFPCDSESAELRAETLEEELPTPLEDAADEERQAWAGATYARLKPWSEECPDVVLYRFQRFLAAMEWKGLSDVQGLAEIDALQAFEAGGKAGLAGSWLQNRAGRFLLERRLELPRVAALAERMREKAAAAFERRSAMAGLPPEMLADFERSRDFELWEADKLELRAHLATDALSEAWAVLDRMAASLGAEPAEGADPEARKRRAGRDADRALLEGEILARMGQSLDALAMYRQGFDLRREAGARPKPEELAAARQLWDRLGGGPEVWETFSGVSRTKSAEASADGGDWKTLTRPLPEFSLRDVGGKVWTLDALKGKTVLINIWATWCKPCHLELPHVQKLHEQFKDDPNVLVATLNIDASIGLVEPFLSRKELTFPALLGFDFIEQITGGNFSIPRNWLLSPDGIIRHEQVGFSPEESEEWRADLAARLEAGLASP